MSYYQHYNKRPHHQPPHHHQPPNWWQQPHNNNNSDNEDTDTNSAFSSISCISSSNGKRSRVEPMIPSSSSSTASEVTTGWPSSTHSLTSSRTTSTRTTRAENSSSSTSRVRLLSSSPPLPDEELTSVLQNFLDESRERNSHNKMEAVPMSSNDYYYGTTASSSTTADPYYNQTFLPNVSPSASSLDSGYCGPASVQSSIDSPQFGYPQSPWQTPSQHNQQQQSQPHQDYYMHSECSSPPTANYNNIANNNGQQDGCFPNGSYVLGKNNNSSSPGPGSHLHDQDISHIVDQVLSCIDQFEDLNPNNDSSSNNSSYRDGLDSLLCHNCGALMKAKTEQTCRQCATPILNNETTDNDHSSLSLLEPSKKAKKRSRNKCSRVEYEEEENSTSENYWTGVPINSPKKSRTVGIVEPRVIPRSKPQQQVQKPFLESNQHHQNQWNGNMSNVGPQSACSVMSNAKHGVINSNSPPCIGQTCSDFKAVSSTSTASVMSSPVAATSALSQKSPHHTATMHQNKKRKWTSSYSSTTTYSSSDSSSSESSESYISSSSTSEDELEEPIKLAKIHRSRQKLQKLKNKSKKNRVKRKAEALLRLAASSASPLSTASSSNNYKSFKDESPQATADVNSSDNDIIKSDVTNSSASALMTNFSLKTPDDQWMYCDVRGCSFWTRKPERMERHRKCHRPDTKYYKCPDCSLRFYSLAKMLKHDRKVHTGVKDYECRVCEAEVTDIQIHMRVHKAEKQFECPVCPMEFRHKNSLVRHLCQHTGERPYRCQCCDSAFISMHRLKDHMRKQHPEIKLDNYGSNGGSNTSNGSSNLIVPNSAGKKNVPEIVISPEKQQVQRRRLKSVREEDLKVITPKEIFVETKDKCETTNTFSTLSKAAAGTGSPKSNCGYSTTLMKPTSSPTTTTTLVTSPLLPQSVTTPSGTHLTSFVTATPLSLIQASNGQVYILQNQQQLPHQPQHQQITGCCHPSGNPHFSTTSNSTQSQGTTTNTGTTTQFFPTQMILAAAQTVSPGAAASGDNCNINSQLILAATTTNKLTSCLSTSNWLQPTTTASPAIHGHCAPTAAARVMLDGSACTLIPALDIDLGKSKKNSTDIVTKALVASKVLKGC